MDSLLWIHVTCVKNVENWWTICYNLIRCEVARELLWYEVFNRIGVVLMMPRRVVDLFACCRGLMGNSLYAAVWNMIPLCLAW